MRFAAERRRAAQQQLERDVGRCGIPKRFLDRTFAGFEAVTAEQRQALAACRAYAEDFEQVRQRGTCLLLAGGPGTGKTHLACAILADVIRAGHTGLFMSVSAALRMIRDAYSPRAQRSESEAFAPAHRTRTCWSSTRWAWRSATRTTRRAMLFDVLDTRYAEMRPTILIGNLTAAEMEAYLGERIMDRLLELGSATVPFTWPSHRRGKRDV